MKNPVAFDILAPLPAGTTLLEASAGTGKTYTIAALATRYIAEGLTTIDQMLMITFGRSATRELRERVRESLTTARDALRSGHTKDDEVLTHLNALPPAEREAAEQRLARAVADFDSGTIVTTHAFCLHTLSGLGISADTDPGEVSVESIADLIDEVVDDFYVRKYGQGAAVDDRIPYPEARSLAREAVGDPQAALNAGPVTPGSIQATRVAFAEAVRAEVARRRRVRRLLTYDDLVLRLRDALTDPATGDLACRRLREKYQVVLVDEFQDTDPAQWTILQRAFHGHRTLILIGDPKQAIYAFRGADVYSYLDAAQQADHHATLETNWRSDAPVVQGVDALMGGMQLGDKDIVVRSVSAHHLTSRLQGVVTDTRVTLRTLPATPDDFPPVKAQRTAVAADVAASIVDLLTGPARLGSRPVRPGDIAVLTNTHAQAGFVQQTLAAAHVPVVVTSPTSVFGTDAAQQWARLLRAMQRPRGSDLRHAALTDFFGRTPDELALDGEQLDSEVALLLRQWAQVLDDASVAEMVAQMEQDTAFAARVLSRPDGERTLTDLRHVAGALHAQQRSTRAGLIGLYDWLTAQIRRTQDGGREPTTELTRRLESDAEAVQVLTIHVSKGLEFPIVFVPFGWDRFPPKPDQTLRCHDADGRRVLDVRGRDAIDRADLVAARDREDEGESLRLLYVAMTRASSQLVVHWAPSAKNTPTGPLHRVLSARVAGHLDPEPSYPVTGVPQIASDHVHIEEVAPRVVPVWRPPVPPTAALSVAPYDRHLDRTWRRTSYSGLTAAVHEAEYRPGGFRTDEPDEAVEHVGVALEGPPSPFAEMPAGAAFGTLVHGVLELVDTSADLPSELARRCHERLAAFPVAGVDADALAAALLPVLHTPLGSAGLTLGQILPADRLPELDFEFPMAGAQTLADLADLLRDHLPADDPLAGYADRLDSPGLAQSSLVGYLAGSIDAVLRIPGPKFIVVDYKTNLLRDAARPGIERLVAGYEPAALATAMIDAHYPLQALLYGAALHRYLRWRQPGYDPDVHLGGVMYLFVRGMAGPGTQGVFEWHPPAGLVVALSDLLDGVTS